MIPENKWFGSADYLARTPQSAGQKALAAWDRKIRRAGLDLFLAKKYYQPLD
jgi:hypothetical protein